MKALTSSLLSPRPHSVFLVYSGILPSHLMRSLLPFISKCASSSTTAPSVYFEGKRGSICRPESTSKRAGYLPEAHSIQGVP